MYPDLAHTWDIHRAHSPWIVMPLIAHTNTLYLFNMNGALAWCTMICPHFDIETSQKPMAWVSMPDARWPMHVQYPPVTEFLNDLALIKTLLRIQQDIKSKCVHANAIRRLFVCKTTCRLKQKWTSDSKTALWWWWILSWIYRTTQLHAQSRYLRDTQDEFVISIGEWHAKNEF